MIPAGITFKSALKKNSFEQAAQIFINKHIEPLQYGSYLKETAKIIYTSNTDKAIIINPIGLVKIDSTTIIGLNANLKLDTDLVGATLTVVPNAIN